MIASSSPSRMPSINRRPSALAASRRLGATSFAFMLDELSTTRTRRRARACCQRKIGSASAKTRKARNASCNSKESKCRSFCHKRSRLFLLEDLLPEEEGRHRDPAQADLQDVKHDDRQCQAGQQECGWVDQAHAIAPAARIIRSSSSSKGISVEERVLPIP